MKKEDVNPRTGGAAAAATAAAAIVTVLGRHTHCKQTSYEIIAKSRVTGCCHAYRCHVRFARYKHRSKFVIKKSYLVMK